MLELLRNALPFHGFSRAEGGGWRAEVLLFPPHIGARWGGRGSRIILVGGRPSPALGTALPGSRVLLLRRRILLLRRQVLLWLGPPPPGGLGGSVRLGGEYLGACWLVRVPPMKSFDEAVIHDEASPSQRGIGDPFLGVGTAADSGLCRRGPHRRDAVEEG